MSIPDLQGRKEKQCEPTCDFKMAREIGRRYNKPCYIAEWFLILISTLSCRIERSNELINYERNEEINITLMAVATASATTPGGACHVPRPTEGIRAPVFNSKNRIALAMFPASCQ